MSLINFTGKTLRYNTIPLMLQLLTTLRFLASGSCQSVIADTVSVSRSYVSRIVRTVCSELAGIAQAVITFPQDQRLSRVEEGFLKLDVN